MTWLLIIVIQKSSWSIKSNFRPVLIPWQTKALISTQSNYFVQIHYFLFFNHHLPFWLTIICTPLYWCRLHITQSALWTWTEHPWSSDPIWVIKNYRNYFITAAGKFLSQQTFHPSNHCIDILLSASQPRSRQSSFSDWWVDGIEWAAHRVTIIRFIITSLLLPMPLIKLWSSSVPLPLALPLPCLRGGWYEWWLRWGWVVTLVKLTMHVRTIPNIDDHGLYIGF